MRYVLVDRIVSLTPGVMLRAIKNVSAADDMITRYGPGRWALPATMVLEAMAQATGLLVVATLGGKALPVLAKVKPFTSYTDATPGDQVCLEAQLEELRHGGCRASATASVCGRRLADATIYLALIALEEPGDAEARAPGIASGPLLAALTDAFPGWFEFPESLEKRQ
jgi:3-hydroxyacyl-[acyl-carrier-protein] dehydratase